MKKFRLINIIVVIALLLAAVPVVYAQGPAGTWVSGITCQNLDTVYAAEVIFEFYQEGVVTPALTYSDSIPPGGTLKYFTPSSPVGLPAPFTGAVTVSSSTALTCNVNTQANTTGSSTSPYRIGTSAGFDSAQVGPVMYLPQVIKAAGTWNSYVAVQNTTGSDVIVDVQYYNRTTGLEITAAKQTVTIKANSNKMVYQASNVNLPAGFNGGAKVSAVNPNTTPLAAVVNFYNDGATYSSSQFHSYNGMASGANKVFLPRVVRRYYGYNSGITIQNVGLTEATATIDFMFKDGSTYTYSSPTIQPSASLVLYATSIAAIAGVDAKWMGYRVASAVVTASVGDTIIVTVNEDNRGDPADNDGGAIPVGNIGKGSTYNGFLDGTQSFNVYIVQLTKRAGGFFTGGLVIANTEALAGTCDLTFVGDADAFMNDVTLPASGLISLYAGTQIPNLNDGFNAGVSITCTKNVFTIANLSAEAGFDKYGDSFTQSNGYNQ